MKSRHITEILDRAAFVELSEGDLATIEAHTADCRQCRKSFEAAKFSGRLLSARAASVAHAAPSPFFQAKVLNAFRQRQNLRSPIAAFRRWWQASAMPVFLMLITVGVLISLTLFAPQSISDDSEIEISSFNPDSSDAVMFDRNQPRDLTNEQVFQAIYDARSDSKK